jgi:hypothetical protein
LFSEQPPSSTPIRTAAMLLGIVRAGAIINELECI